MSARNSQVCDLLKGRNQFLARPFCPSMRIGGAHLRQVGIGTYAVWCKNQKLWKFASKLKVA